MKFKNIIILFELAIIFENCGRGQSHNEVPIQNERLSQLVEQRDELNDSLYRLLNELNIQSIKRKYGRGSTSTLLNESETMYLFKPDAEGFYGQYFFVNPTASNNLPYLSKAVIFSHKKPWTYSDNTEKLIEFTVYSNDISLSDKVKVGMSQNEVLINLGKPNFQGVDYLLYRDEVGAILTFKLKSDRVVAIKLGLYKNEELGVLGEALTKNF